MGINQNNFKDMQVGFETVILTHFWSQPSAAIFEMRRFIQLPMAPVIKSRNRVEKVTKTQQVIVLYYFSVND
jgi:hypothetical protein